MKYKKRTFEEFLGEVHMDLHPACLDDDLPDSYDNWLGEMNIDDCIEWANLYAEEQYITGKEEIIKQL